MTAKNLANRLSSNSKAALPLVQRVTFILLALIMGYGHSLLAAQEASSSPAEIQQTNTSPSDTQQADKQLVDKQKADKTKETKNSKPAAEIKQSAAIEQSQQDRALLQALKNKPWAFLHPYKATYDISADGDSLGKAQRELIKENGEWTLRLSSKLSKYMLSLRSNESSRFRIDGNRFLLSEFNSKTKISFKKARKVNQQFDWQNKVETGNRGKKKWSLPLEEPVFDRTSHVLKMRSDLLTGEADFSYLVSYKGRRKEYSYVFNGKEKLTTKFGTFDTIKMVRTSGDDSQFTLWLSPELNYFPVQIAQYEQDKPEVEMSLSSLEFLPFGTVAQTP